MHKKVVDIVLIPLSSPIKVGVYENGQLLDIIESNEKSSEVLPLIFKSLLDEYTVSRMVYANGPGSFMAIKVAYIFLKSLSILKKIPLYACDAFYFNNERPIKAIGKLYFVKMHEEIKTQKFDEVRETHFALPNTLDFKKFNTNTTPLYKIGAVG